MRNDRAFTARGSDEDSDELVGLAWDRGRAFRIPVPVPYSVFVRFRRLSKQEVTNAQPPPSSPCAIFPIGRSRLKVACRSTSVSA